MQYRNMVAHQVQSGPRVVWKRLQIAAQLSRRQDLVGRRRVDRVQNDRSEIPRWPRRVFRTVREDSDRKRIRWRGLFGPAPIEPHKGHLACTSVFGEGDF